MTERYNHEINKFTPDSKVKVETTGNSGSSQIAPFGEVATASPFARIALSFPYNINSALIDSITASTGTVTQADSMAVLQTGTGTTGSAEISSHDSIRYIPGQGVSARFTALFTTGVAGSLQKIGIGNDTDGYFVGINGASGFSILIAKNGSSTWIDSASFSDDMLDGSGSFGFTLDETKGNVFKIEYQWLGFGAISFYIENPLTGEFFLFHRVAYANNNTTPSTYNPTFHLHAHAIKTSGATNITLKTASMGAYSFGHGEGIGVKRAKSNLKTSITTETNILTIRNKLTNVLGGTNTNRVTIDLTLLSISSDGSKLANIKVLENTTLGGTPSYTDVDTNVSVVEFDTAGTTVTGGNEVLDFQLGKTDSEILDLVPLSFSLQPGDSLTISASSSAATEVGISISWKERQ